MYANKKLTLHFKLLALFFCLLGYGAAANGQSVEIYEPYSELFTSPLGIEYAENEPAKIYLVERVGKIKRLDIQQLDDESELWFDISDRIDPTGEQGLLGLTFHPEFPNNSTFYINYTVTDNDGQIFTRISRFRAPGGESDLESEEVLLEFEQPQNNHNGGQLAFGPDGYLYIALGDGGRNSSSNSQDTQNIHGNILRIDVNTSEGYAIPGDNPFVGSDEGLDEIMRGVFVIPGE